MMVWQLQGQLKTKTESGRLSGKYSFFFAIFQVFRFKLAV